MEIAYLDASKWIRYWVFLVQSNKYCYFCPPDGTYVNISSGGKSCSIYLIWTKNTQYPIYWFVSKYASSMLLAKVLYTLFIVNLIQHGTLPLLDDAFILMKRKIYLQIIMFCLKFFIFLNSLLHIMYEYLPFMISDTNVTIYFQYSIYQYLFMFIVRQVKYSFLFYCKTDLCGKGGGYAFHFLFLN